MATKEPAPMQPSVSVAASEKSARLTRLQRAELAVERERKRAADSAARKKTHKDSGDHFRSLALEAIRAFRKRDWDTVGVCLMQAVEVLNAIRDESRADG